MAHVVITGGAGFIGSHLCERLISEGYDVICLDNLVTGKKENLQALLDHERFSFRLCDVANEYVAIDGPVDYVLHFASPASPQDYFNLPIQTLKVGSLGTHKALGLAKAKKAVFMLASTSEVYGDPDIHPQPEEYWGNVNPVGPRSVYDEAKRFAEALTMAYHRSHQVPVRIARIFNTYGPRMRLDDGRVVPNFIKQALLAEPITIYGDGSQTRAFCFIDDMIEGLYRLMHSEVNQPVNLGNDREITIMEFAQAVTQITDSRSTIIHQDAKEDDPKRRCPQLNKARKFLNWTAQVPLEQGLMRTVEWFKNLGVIQERMKAGKEQ